MADNNDPERGVSYEVLHERARSLLANGDLPRQNCTRLYAGYGSDRMCQLCARAITSRDVEYELEFAFSAAGSTKTRLVWFHLACHAIWDYERKREG